MKSNLIIILVVFAALSLSSYVATKKYTNAKLRIGYLRAYSMRLSRTLEECKTTNTGLNTNIDSLNSRMDKLITAAKTQISSQKNKISSSEEKIAAQEKRLAELQEIID